ncbi:hypothetical protein [Hydrogenophaga sp.]|uniref:hypothetical protein n=1 Tax=Hydrogenophaga sp. TaxID=1904254 RepID=UPI0027157795|nr:hypothetical protein [Hydrogenophaga sp.]MDO9131976.1 hypothetical protein [Hydrogenophaga sp.]
MKTLFLDCEFNGMGGALMSMALVGEDVEWYEVLPTPTSLDPWVAEHVVPHLNQTAVYRGEFQRSLQAFLMAVGPCIIVADWPDDIRYFCESLITAPGVAINTPPIMFELDRTIEYVSAIPHNALEDARAIKRSRD